ncbi:MAG: DUF2064 domain-containing protein [bacterium]|nr:DUF2064 domain-containing protein [bacterium]
MPEKKKIDSVVAICIQEPTEEGSSMDFGIIKGDNLRFLHQAFITDTITNAFDVGNADVRLYHVDQTDRKRLIKIVTEYLTNKLDGKRAEALKNRFTVIEQSGGAWAERMDAVFHDCFDQGYKHVLLLGSRTPTITSKMMKTALKMLNESDAVFGPTPEGRYYSLGMSGSLQIQLRDFDWKAPTIYHDVANAFTSAHLSWAELEIWYAVENPDYLETMARDINQFRFEGDEFTARETEVVIERILTRLEP